MVAYLLGIFEGEAFITLISGLIIAFVVFFLYNSSYIIRKKTRAEAMQKLKLDSMLATINETGEFQKAITEYNLIMINSAEDVVYSISDEGNVSENNINFFVLQNQKKFVGIAHESSGTINKFILLLKRDMIINGKDEKVEKEIEKIQKIYDDMKNFLFALDTKKLANNNKNESVVHIWNKGAEIKAIIKINKSIENLWKIYKEKLDKEQEDWLDKLLNYFHAVKKDILMKIKRKSAR